MNIASSTVKDWDVNISIVWSWVADLLTFLALHGLLVYFIFPSILPFIDHGHPKAPIMAKNHKNLHNIYTK